jgi:hypothetical protein
MEMQKQLAGMRTSQLEERYEYLKECRKVSLRRARLADSKAAQLQIEELETRRQEIRRKYLGINTHAHTSIVVATLAALQGQEVEIQDQLRGWKAAKKQQKDIDVELSLCENVLIERKKTNQ